MIINEATTDELHEALAVLLWEQTLGLSQMEARSVRTKIRAIEITLEERSKGFATVPQFVIHYRLCQRTAT